jgi:hypothetical protein
VKISFLGQHHIIEVHEKNPREILPTKNAVLNKPPV